MKKNTIIMSFLTSEDTTQWQLGRELLEIFASLDKRLIPEYLFHWSEKIGSFESVDSCKEYWVPFAQMRTRGSMSEFPIGLRWKRQKTTKYEAEMIHPQRNQKGRLVAGHFSFEGVFHDKIGWNSIFERLCKVLVPSSAILHVFGSFETKSWPLLTAADDKIENLGHSCLLPEFLLDTSLSLTISAAGFPIQKIGDGYLVQVTDDINDVTNDFVLFSKRRAELKSLFRDGLFLIKDEPKIF